jgi:hypothetical protein
MIAEVQRALGRLLAPLLPDGCAVRFGLSAPGGDGLVWSLAGVREDESGGGTDWTDVRDEATGRVVARRPPVRRFDLSYRVTAAASDPDVEAALLDAVLTAVDPGRRLPAESAMTSRLGEPAGDGTLTVIVNAPLVLPVVTELAAPAEDIRLGVAAPGRPVRPAAPRRPVGRWRGTEIAEEPHAVRGQDD